MPENFLLELDAWAVTSAHPSVAAAWGYSGHQRLAVAGFVDVELGHSYPACELRRRCSMTASMWQGHHSAQRSRRTGCGLRSTCSAPVSHVQETCAAPSGVLISADDLSARLRRRHAIHGPARRTFHQVVVCTTVFLLSGAQRWVPPIALIVEHSRNRPEAGAELRRCR